MYGCEWDMYWRIFCNFPLVAKKCESRSKITLFSNERHFENFIFKKEKQLRFSEVNYLNYTKRTQFCMWNYSFPKQGETRTSSGPIPPPLITSSNKGSILYFTFSMWSNCGCNSVVQLGIVFYISYLNFVTKRK